MNSRLRLCALLKKIVRLMICHHTFIALIYELSKDTYDSLQIKKAAFVNPDHTSGSVPVWDGMNLILSWRTRLQSRLLLGLSEQKVGDI